MTHQFDFTPVPRQRKRRDVWTELAQRAFIAKLAGRDGVRAAAVTLNVAHGGMQFVTLEGRQPFGGQPSRR